ncbi:glycosyltransferase family protein [Phenylobacterium sp. LjRoot219]|uniref:cytidylyltransferase domain-containing protein n=1 Tax=Phenylobacterium sp. LjRoot219 TaxID=3342283 RepID=UPI003ECC253E
MRILTILQARMSSTRLPGKVMTPLLGQPMMARQIERLRRARRIGELVVATSVEPGDAVVEQCALELGCLAYRGPLVDVLGRYADALEQHGPADHVVRVTADCPLADWRVIDRVIEHHLATGADYTSNTVERTYPKGLDVEVVRAPLLLQAAREAEDPYEREHVTPFFYFRPERFRIEQVTQGLDQNLWRWTVDTPADFAFTRSVYEALYPTRPDFLSEDIQALPGATRTDPDDPGVPPAPSESP